jgi:hypothetical protein
MAGLLNLNSIVLYRGRLLGNALRVLFVGPTATNYRNGTEFCVPCYVASDVVNDNDIPSSAVNHHTRTNS